MGRPLSPPLRGRKQFQHLSGAPSPKGEGKSELSARNCKRGAPSSQRTLPKRRPYFTLSPEKLQPSVTCGVPSVGIGLMSSQKVQTPPNTSRSRFGGPWNVTSNPPQCFDPSDSSAALLHLFDVPPCALHAQIAIAVAVDFAGHLAGKLLEDEREGAIGQLLDGQRPPAGFPFADRVDGPDGKRRSSSKTARRSPQANA